MKFLVLPMLVLLAAPAVAADYLGEVLAASDGDTFTIQSETGKVRVRICGIAAPERGQPGYRVNRDVGLSISRVAAMTKPWANVVSAPIAAVRKFCETLSERLTRAHPDKSTLLHG
jgi:endonuclease YncB( thermonuclease family)